MKTITKAIIVSKTVKSKEWKLIFIGILFSFLWSSASTATKIGLNSAQPFVISIFRFLIAGLIMLFVTHIIMGNRMPSKKEWLQISIYGLFNISLYLGLYVIAMQQVSAGLGSLAVATNPVFITLISTVWFSHKIKLKTILSLIICFTGILLASYPLLLNNSTTITGILILLSSMIAYSLGTIYYSRVNWNGLHILTINGWQTIIGAFFLLPALFLTYRNDQNNFDTQFWISVSWLAIPVSIGAVLFWLYLLKNNPVKASYWLFLCPVFGFIIAHIMTKESINLYTFFGVAFVIYGLIVKGK